MTRSQRMRELSAMPGIWKNMPGYRRRGLTAAIERLSRAPAQAAAGAGQHVLHLALLDVLLELGQGRRRSRGVSGRSREHGDQAGHAGSIRPHQLERRYAR